MGSQEPNHRNPQTHFFSFDMEPSVSCCSTCLQRSTRRARCHTVADCEHNSLAHNSKRTVQHQVEGSNPNHGFREHDRRIHLRIGGEPLPPGELRRRGRVCRGPPLCISDHLQDGPVVTRATPFVQTLEVVCVVGPAPRFVPSGVSVKRVY